MLPIVASGPQPPQPGEDSSGLARLGFVAGGIAAGGFIPYKGNRLWDTYLKGIRAVETGFPSAILRTFRVSEFLSPLESWNNLLVPQNILASGGKYTEYLQSVYGSGIDDIALKRSGAIFGEVTTGGKAVGLGLQITAGSQKGAGIADYFARLSGVELGLHESLNDSLLRAQWREAKTSLSFSEWLEGLAPHARRERLVLGARFRDKLRILGKDFELSDSMKRGVAKLEITSKLLRAKAASTAGRLNNLLTKPFELPVVGGLLEKIPVIKSMAVKPGSATQMLGRYTKKALIAGAAWKGLEYYDYLRSQHSPWAVALGSAGGAAVGGLLFKKLGTRFSLGAAALGTAVGLYTSIAPRFDYGIFHGAASILTDLNLARAGLSEKIGLTESLRRQEAVTPGLVSPSTAIAFGGIGAMGAGLVSYGSFLTRAARQRFSGGNLADIFETLRETNKGKFAEKLWGSGFGKAIQKIPGGKLLSKVKNPMALGFIGGVAAWGLATTGLSLLSGNILAAIPGLNIAGTTETPEELQRIYSGEEEVPIRKGRFWEFGRSSKYEGCLTSDSTILMADGTTKLISEIKIGDKVINSNGIVTIVTNIASRKINESVFKICSQWDKSDTTKVTKNHEILACKIEKCKKNKDCFCAPKVKATYCHKCNAYKYKNYTPEWISADKLTKDHALFIPEISLPSTLEYINTQDCLPSNYIIDGDKVYVRANSYSAVGNNQQELDREILKIGSLPFKSAIRRKKQSDVISLFKVSDNYIKNRLNDLRRKRRKTRFAGYRQIGIWPKKINLDYDFGMLVGYYASEGNIDKNCGTVSFSFHEDENKYIEDVIRLVGLFGCKTKIRQQADTKGIVIDIYNTILKYVLSYLCPGTALGKNKQLNSILLNAPDKFLDGFLEAFINGDGSPKPDKCNLNIGLSTPVLLKQIQLIMAHKGVCSSLNSRMANSVVGQEKKHKTYELLISGFDAEELYSLMRDPKPGQHVASYKGAKKIRIFGGWLLKIKDIEKFSYKGKVWDIQVAEGNSFMSSGMVLHNSRIEYFRPHFLERLRTRAYEKGLYGDESERWEYDPVLHPLKALLGPDEWKYHYEEKYQYERPAPLTLTYGEDIPFLGPAIAATLGKLLKPRKLIRPEEWNYGGGEYRHLPDIRGESEPAYELGGLKPGAPVEQEEGSQLLNELLYRRREAVGLVGFAEGAIQKALTGREEPFQNLQTIATMGKETGSEYWLWKHLNLGGAAGTSEAIRRFIPHTRSYLDFYNPLQNTLPSWMPSDYFLDLKHGNPLQKVAEGELRLPGPGYAARFPELEGVSAEEYPLVHRVKILCLDKDTMIPTNCGIKKISEITNNDKVIGSDGYLHNIIDIQISKEEKDTLEIYTYYNYRPLVCSKNHKILIGNKNGDVVEKCAGDISKDDYLLYPKLKFGNNKNICIGDYCSIDDVNIVYSNGNYLAKAKGSHNYINFNLKADYFMGFVFGLYLAEGNITKNRITWTFNKNEENTLGVYIREFAKKIGLNFYNRIVENSNVYQITINNKLLASFFYSIFNTGSANKEIKIDLQSYPKEFAQGIFDGHFNGDGCFFKTNNNIVARSTSISEKLLYQLKIIGCGLSVLCGINERKGNSWTGQQSFYMDIQRRDLNKINIYKKHIQQECKYNPSKSKKMNFEDDNYIFVRVKDIKEIHKRKDWYDLCIDGYNQIHLFTTISGIVHNSDVAMWSDEYKQTLAKAKRNINRMSDYEKHLIRTTEEQVRAKKKRKEFYDYRFDEDLLTSQEVTVTDVMDPRRIKTAEFGDMTVELQGVGAVQNMQEAMSRAKEVLQGQKIKVYMPTMESRRIDTISSGGRLKAVAMLGDMDYGQAMAQEGYVQSKALEDEFEQLRFTPSEKFAGKISEALLHGAETPIEYLTPVSPAAKLIRRRTAIEDYIASEAVGTGNAFWDKPVENFLKPAANMTLHGLGFSGVPEEVRQRRDINEYFDMLKWVKAEKLEQEARQENRWQEVKEQQQIQQETLFGVDVFGSPTKIMKALPRSERDYYADFVQAKTQDERAEILQLIPENERRIYLSQWLRQEEETAMAKKEAKIATSYDDQTIAVTQKARRSEGFQVTPDLEEQWLAETNGKIPFDEWIRQKKAEEYFRTHSLPGPDWIGWHPSCDMEDVRLKYVEMQGLDHHDFDLWGARRRSLARKPYIDEELIKNMEAKAELDEVIKTRINAKAIAEMHGNKDARINIERVAADMKENYDFEIVDGREELIKDTYKYMGAR